MKPVIYSVLALLALGKSAWALPSIAPKIRDKEIRVGLTTNTYLTTSKETVADQGTGNMGLNVGVRGIGHKENFVFGIEADSLYGLRRANYRYLDIAEAFLGYDRKDLYAYLGRKRFDWSAMDSYWGLGLFQPRFRWDYLNERENGLFGLFLGHRSELLQATAYVSPIFVPEQGAPFDIDGGACKTASPWFSCPASSIFLFNQETDVRFSLDIPPVQKLIAHWGGGAMARVGRELGPFGRLAFTRKPMNQLLLSFEGRLNHSTQQIPAVIRPRVLYHDLYGLDLGWNLPRHSVTASALIERPERDETPANWNTQEADDAFLSGVTFKTMPLTGRFRHTRLELAYFHREKGNAPDRGPFIQPGTSIFEPRYALKDALSFAVFSPILDRWASSFLASTKFVWDSANDGNILQSDLYFRPFSRTFFNLGIDLLGSNSSSPVDFISRYQRNDRVRGSVTYVF